MYELHPITKNRRVAYAALMAGVLAFSFAAIITFAFKHTW